MPRSPELALALLRLMLGAIFALHGTQAIFMTGLGPTTAQFKAWHAPMPLLTAPLVATLELAGGVLIVLGLGARPFAFALACVMGAAIYYAHWGKDFFKGGMELPVILLVCALAIAVGGPGKPSFDQLRGEVLGPPEKPVPPRTEPPPAPKRVTAQKKQKSAD